MLAKMETDECEQVDEKKSLTCSCVANLSSLSDYHDWTSLRHMKIQAASGLRTVDAVFADQEHSCGSMSMRRAEAAFLITNSG